MNLCAFFPTDLYLLKKETGEGATVFKYSAWSENFFDSVDRVVLYLCAEGDQVEINTIYKAMGHNLFLRETLDLCVFC